MLRKSKNVAGNFSAKKVLKFKKRTPDCENMIKKIKTVMFSFFLVIVFSSLCVSKDGVAVSKDGTPIVFSVYGKGEPALVFVHGWSCNRSFWRKQIPYFKKKYTVVTLDLAGHGRSGHHNRTVYSPQSFAEDVAAVISEIGADRVVLIGHSMSGAVIIETYKLVPGKVAALIGIDTMRDLSESYTREQADNFIRPFKENFKKSVDSGFGNMFAKGTDKRFIGAINGIMRNANPKVAVSALEEMFVFSYIDNPPEINVPVWCLNTDLYPTKTDINRRIIPQFQLRIMPGAGHFIMLEKPDEFNKELDGILHEALKK